MSSSENSTQSAKCWASRVFEMAETRVFKLDFVNNLLIIETVACKLQKVGYSYESWNTLQNCLKMGLNVLVELHSNY